LSDMIVTELEQNPVLDEVEPGAGEEAPEEDDETQVEAGSKAEAKSDEVEVAEAAAAEASEGEPDLGSDVEERDPFDEIDFGQTFEEYLDPGYKTREFEERDEVSYENFLTRPPSLQ